eukprot:CAMPEP_0176319172 /NCGR_PEP_ID=MMETSP0121_2-20121125/70162_1 /TAXON_ID=160619 /ORGANISM="Kryptoperidinium foliaceum, Strain CCMP 1326" /LENGTH=35 /DNA_ID= /DNA_START= /DNA_END= /DNA_ORIENTATION=
MARVGERDRHGGGLRTDRSSATVNPESTWQTLGSV